MNKIFESIYKKFNENSLSDFFINYASEFKEAESKVNELKTMMKDLPESFYDFWEKDSNDPLKRYDDQIAEEVMNLATSPSAFNRDRIADIAIRNFNQNGTEPQMIFDCIDSLYSYVKRYLHNKA